MIKNISVYIITILILYEMYNFIATLSKKEKYNKCISIILIMIFALLYNNLYIHFPAEIYSFLPLLFISIICLILLKINIKEWFFYIIITGIIGLTVDILLMLIVSLIRSVNILQNAEMDIIQIFSSTVMIIVYYILSKSIAIQKFIKGLFKRFNKVNSSNILIFVLLVAYFIVAIMCLNEIENKSLILMSLLILSSTLLFLINFITNNYQIKMLKENRDLLIRNNEFYIALIDDYRIMKHNLINKLLGLKTVSNSKTKKLIDEIILEYNSTFKTTKDIKNIPVGINGIIYEKLYNLDNVEDLNIYIENKIKSNILEELTPKNYNSLCEALGVTLDNALEASLNSKEKVVYLKLSETNEKIIINIQNTFSGSIDFDKLGKINYSSKGTNHGLGLASLLRKSEIELTTSIKLNLFIVKILVNKK